MFSYEYWEIFENSSLFRAYPLNVSEEQRHLRFFLTILLHQICQSFFHLLYPLAKNGIMESHRLR